MEPYEVLIRKPYNKNACFQAYQELVSNPRNEVLVLQALERSLPVLGSVLGTCFRKVEKDTSMYEEIIERVPYDFYTYLMSDGFYNNFYLNKENHFSYLWGVFRNKVSSALTVFRKSIPRRVPSYIGPCPEYYLELLPSSINMGIFLEQLPKAMSEDAERLIRFRDEPDYSICRTALECIITKNIIPWHAMRTIAPEYTLPELEFLASHAAAVLRNVMYKYKEHFEDLRSELRGELEIASSALHGDCIESGGYLIHDSNDTRKHAARSESRAV